MPDIDLNADLGEGGLRDAELIALVSSANIACGGHAGDESSMRAAIETAVEAGVAIGAHPGYEDPANFGRKARSLEGSAVADLISRQVERLLGFAREAGTEVHHVKPHGALYLQANRDPSIAAAVVTGVKRVLPGCALYVPASGALAAAGNAGGFRIKGEGFVDRRYGEDGELLPRDQAGAVITDLATAVAQALQIACEQRVSSITGRLIPLPTSTLCVHGDGANALTLLREVRFALESAGLSIRA